MTISVITITEHLASPTYLVGVARCNLNTLFQTGVVQWFGHEEANTEIQRLQHEDDRYQ